MIHSYQNPGRFRAIVQVTDAEGGTTAKDFDVDVLE